MCNEQWIKHDRLEDKLQAETFLLYSHVGCQIKKCNFQDTDLDILKKNKSDLLFI